MPCITSINALYETRGKLKILEQNGHREHSHRTVHTDKVNSVALHGYPRVARTLPCTASLRICKNEITEKETSVGDSIVTVRVDIMSTMKRRRGVTLTRSNTSYLVTYFQTLAILTAKASASGANNQHVLAREILSMHVHVTDTGHENLDQ